MASNRKEILVHVNRGHVRECIADESKPAKDGWRAVFLALRLESALEGSSKRLTRCRCI